MAKRLGITWILEPHTLAKHDILRNYFQRWYPIMGKLNPRLIYVDGFAGPGRYAKGEDGSPLVILKAARDHSYNVTADLQCIFIEADENRFKHLQNEIASIEPPLPGKISAVAFHGRFDTQITSRLGFLKAGVENEPVFVFIDPFGFTHTPFETVRRIMANKKGEVLVNFMFEEVNRFIALEKHAKDYDDLFGDRGWREALLIEEPVKRRDFLKSLYINQLRGVSKFVYSFEMINKKNTTDYFLFFATHHIRGLEKMKEAMWQADENGEFRFSDREALDSQANLFANQPNLEPLKVTIARQFKGQTVTVEQLEQWVIIETKFLPSHLRKAALAPLETEGVLQVETKSNRQKGTFPAHAALRFS